jgi:hypothetical protein
VVADLGGLAGGWGGLPVPEAGFSLAFESVG